MDEAETALSDDPPQPMPPVHGGSICIDLIDREHRLANAERSSLAHWLPRAIEPLGLAGEVRVVVVGDAEMSAAHETHKGVPGTTDVLTFDLREEDDEPGVLDVDAMVCVDEARRRSAELGHEAWHELLLYAVHAVLHCVGYDDAEDEAAARMHAKEDELLIEAGLGPVYARGSSERPSGGASS